MSVNVNRTVFHMLEETIGKKALVFLDRDLGYEGVVAAISENPPGVWLSDAEAVVMRTTLANPLPQVVNRVDRSEIFVNLNSILRMEVLHLMQ